MTCPSRNVPRPRRVLWACLFLGLSMLSCVKVPIDREVVAIHRYGIVPRTTADRADTTLNVLLLVDPFLGNADQRAERMLYTDEENGMNFYYYNRWIAPPEKMVGDALAQDLTAWGLFGRGVYQADAGIIPTHEIQGRLVGLYADNLKGEASAVFEASLTVMRVDPRTYEKVIIYQQSFPVVVERKNRNVDSYVEAANEAVGTWLDQVHSELEDLFRREVKTERPPGAGASRPPRARAPEAPAALGAPAVTEPPAAVSAPSVSSAPALPDSSWLRGPELSDTTQSRPAAPPDSSGNSVRR